MEVAMEDIDFHNPDFPMSMALTGTSTAALALSSLSPNEELELTNASQQHQPFVGKHVRPIRGPLKGYHGLVKAVDNGTALVEWDAMQGKATGVPVGDLELLTEEMLARNMGPLVTVCEKTPEPGPESRSQMTPEELESLGELPLGLSVLERTSARMGFGDFSGSASVGT